MESYDIYKDISKRTDGGIYIGVVGPVRTGKSTFIAKLTEQLVIPNIDDENVRNRVIDELPQSAAGRAIMTTQPKFVPNKAISVRVDDKASFMIRLIDCVGYLVEGATGHMDGEEARMVKTPWFEHEIPFEEAAEIGTRKVIRDHSTVGVIMTTDGTIADIPRANYISAEEKVVREMKEQGKPFVIVLNSADEESDYAKSLLERLKDKYDAPVFLMNVMKFTKDDMLKLLSGLLYEFPVKQINIDISKWFCALDPSHYMRREIMSRLADASEDIRLMRDHSKLYPHFSDCAYIKRINTGSIELGSGKINVEIELKDELFYKILGEECGEVIRDDSHLLSMLKEMVTAKREYDKLRTAVLSAKNTGYGIVLPDTDELVLEEPELTQNGGSFGVKLRANAPSLHIVKVDVKTSVSPMIGDEKQTGELMSYLSGQFERDASALWETDIFGKPLSTVVEDGLMAKINAIPPDAKEKMRETLSRITNEGDGGVLCILL